MNILHVVGARPNFMKAAPVYAAAARRGFAQTLLHTGQHYDAAMSGVFFEQLGLPEPEVNLNVRSGTHAEQTAAVMLGLDPILYARSFDWVLVYGDVNSTLAAALVCAKLGQPLAHVEAGLRSFDRTMPEEINRVVTDRVSDLLFTSSPEAAENLAREGIAPDKVRFVGNVMIDSLVKFLPEARARAEVLPHLPLRGASKTQALPFDDSRLTPCAPRSTRRGEQGETGFILATLHRPANVDDLEVLGAILDSLDRISRRIPVLFPMHPRTRRMLAKCKRAGEIPRPNPLPVDKASRRVVWHAWERGASGEDASSTVPLPLGEGEGANPVPPEEGEGPATILMEPMGYVEFLAYESRAVAVVTDSGGVQEETTYLGVPCLTLRPNTERPITVELGTNLLIGNDLNRLEAEVDKILAGQGKKGKIPPLWDGRAAERIVAELAVTPRPRPER